MGANAQTSVPVFTAGQVLTAQQQTEINTGIPVFATTTTRDAAFGGTGEKTLAEGQYAYIEASNTTQYYDGAAWQALGGGLVYLTSATFTTATSVSLPASTFTSTYRNYRFILSLTALTADADFTLRFRASGTDDSTNNYQLAMNDIRTTGASALATSAGNTSISMAEQDAGLATRYSLVFDVLAPQVAQATIIFGNIQFVDKAATYTASRTGSAFFSNATQFDSLSFISSVASSISGNYRVYAYADS